MSLLQLILQLILTNFILNAYALISKCITMYSSKTINSFFLINFFCITYSYNQVNFIFGLQNVLALIHPIAILLSYSFFSSLFLFPQKFFARNSLYAYVNITFLTLFLGGWWAFQEFNWGGWWNWDSIETPILILLLVLTFVTFHVFYFKHKTLLFQLVSFTKLFGLLLCIIFLPRWGQTNSIHSFINLTDSYLYYHTWILSTTFIATSFVLFLKIFSLWTFFFIKVILLYILSVLILGYLVSRKFVSLSTYHKFLYLLLYIFLLVNIKSLSISTEYLCYNTVNQVFCYSNWFNQASLFWLKSHTVALNSFFFSLKVFLN